MRKDLESLIIKMTRRLGLEVSRFSVHSSDAAKIQKMLSYHKINLILDIGANEGQYVRFLRLAGYRGKVISFEPLRHMHKKLEILSRNDPLWVVAPRMALGNSDGEVEINISANSVSSSIVKMLQAHREFSPESRYIGSERVRLTRLDSIADDYIGEDTSVLLKIDTQGYEEQVLDGAAKNLSRIRGIQIELSLMPLYEGQLSFRDMTEKIIQYGYELHGIFPGFIDVESGRLLQVDGIFFKPYV